MFSVCTICNPISRISLSDSGASRVQRCRSLRKLKSERKESCPYSQMLHLDFNNNVTLFSLIVTHGEKEKNKTKKIVFYLISLLDPDLNNIGNSSTQMMLKKKTKKRKKRSHSSASNQKSRMKARTWVDRGRDHALLHCRQPFLTFLAFKLSFFQRRCDLFNRRTFNFFHTEIMLAF